MENRIIKFRAWDKRKKQMIYSDENCTVWMGGAEVSVNTNNGKIVSDFEGMQYAGLKDKNGKEIYEGDIVEAYTLFDKDVKIKGEVVFTDSGMWKAIDAVYRDAEYLFELVKSKDRCEIIGNIYESPELLNPLNKQS